MNPRLALYGAAVCLSLVGMAGMYLRTPDAPPVPSQAAPILLPASLSVPEPTVRAQTYTEWRESTPRGIATEDEVWVALVEAGMPPVSAAVLARAAVRCESPVLDRDGTSLGARLTAVGDAGASRGPLQIHTGWNPWASSAYLFDLTAAAEAAARIEREGGVGRWSCAR